MRLLEEAGYIEAKLATAMGPPAGVQTVQDFSITRLLNEGHDFLANAKNESVWKQAKTAVQDKAGDVSLGVLKAVLAKFTMQQFGL